MRSIRISICKECDDLENMNITNEIKMHHTYGKANTLRTNKYVFSISQKFVN